MEKRKNSLQNEKLGMVWDLLHDMQELTEKTEFSFDAGEYQKMIKEADRFCSDSSLPLKIVVGGRMKAGKSMMVDTLYFEGRGVLNSDTTPATANIMFIRCSDEEHKPGAVITFLTREEVEEMKTYFSNQNASGGGKGGSITDQLRYKAIKERLEKLEKCLQGNPENEKLIGTTKTVPLEDVKEYSDGDGSFSDLVNQIDLYIDDPGLNGITLVDTPGVGDPVVSRGQKARDESRTADVVFYLSAASHFMDMEDAEEYVRLKKAGCKNIVLIMSRFDEVFEPEDEDEEMECFADSMMYCRLAYEGTQRLRLAMEQAEMTYEEPLIIPLCALGARLSKRKLESDDEFYRESIKAAFPEWDGKDGTLYREFGIGEIRGEISGIREKKEKIRAQSNESRIEHCADQVFRMYEILKGRMEKCIEADERRLDAPASYEPEKTEALGRSMETSIKKALGTVNSDHIVMECNAIEAKINNCCQEAKESIDNAEGPDSINGAYENVFKNTMEDMFVENDSGIRSRMRFEDRNGHYGILIKSFTRILADTVNLYGLDADLVDAHVLVPIRLEFENKLFSQFEAEVNRTMPVVNTREVLQEQYKALRDKSSRYGDGIIFSFEKKNRHIKGECKDITDKAANAVLEIVENFKNKIASMFVSEENENGILTALMNRLGVQISELNKILGENDRAVIKEDIERNKKKLEKLKEQMNEGCQESYQEWKKSEGQNGR